MSMYDDATENPAYAPRPGWQLEELPGALKAVEVQGFNNDTRLKLYFFCGGSPDDPSPDRLLRLGRELLAPKPIDDDLRTLLADSAAVKRYALLKTEVVGLEKRLAVLDARVKELEARKEGWILESPPGLGRLLVQADAQLVPLRTERATLAQEMAAVRKPLQDAQSRAVVEAQRFAAALARQREPTWDVVKRRRAAALRKVMTALGPALDELAAIEMTAPFVVGNDSDASVNVRRFVEEQAARQVEEPEPAEALEPTPAKTTTTRTAPATALA
jgi:hypothetical protein